MMRNISLQLLYKNNWLYYFVILLKLELITYTKSQ